MIYDNTKNLKFPDYWNEHGNRKGYSIHQNQDSDHTITQYEIYTDDGHGNGDYICTCSDYFWACRIAYALAGDHE